MTNKGKQLLSFMAMAMAVNASNQSFAQSPSTPSKPKRTEPVLQNGCQYYHFDIEGNVILISSTNSGTGFFQCVALNERNARKKFNYFKKLTDYVPSSNQLMDREQYKKI